MIFCQVYNMYRKHLNSTNSGLYFLLWSSTLIKGAWSFLVNLVLISCWRKSVLQWQRISLWSIIGIDHFSANDSTENEPLFLLALSIICWDLVNLLLGNFKCAVFLSNVLSIMIASAFLSRKCNIWPPWNLIKSIIWRVLCEELFKNRKTPFPNNSKGRQISKSVDQNILSWLVPSTQSFLFPNCTVKVFFSRTQCLGVHYMQVQTVYTVSTLQSLVPKKIRHFVKWNIQHFDFCCQFITVTTMFLLQVSSSI